VRGGRAPDSRKTEPHQPRALLLPHPRSPLPLHDATGTAHHGIRVHPLLPLPLPPQAGTGSHVGNVAARGARGELRGPLAGAGSGAADSDGGSSSASDSNVAGEQALRRQSLQHVKGGSRGAGPQASEAAGGAFPAAPARPRFKLVLLVVAENEDTVPEADWLRYVDSACDDFELRVNLKAARWGRDAAVAAFPRVTFGRLNPRRLERLLPPANLLTVSLCGTPAFADGVRGMYLDMGLPRTLISITG
jgi:hypothetical protein